MILAMSTSMLASLRPKGTTVMQQFAKHTLPTAPQTKGAADAICKEGKAKNLTSSAFIQKYHLPGSSSVQSAIKGLLEKNFVTSNLGVYEIYDKFFAIWLLGQR